jgi:hypothetical protein
MTIAVNGRLSPLASRVLDHVAQWTREPFHPNVLEIGRDLIGQDGIDQAILSIAPVVTTNHGADAYAHYRGYLLDAACHHAGSLVIDGEMQQVQSHLFLIALDGDLALIDDPAVVEEMIEDLLTSLETESEGAEALIILPKTYTLGGLAAITPEAIRKLLVADRESYSHDLEPILEWGVRTGVDDPDSCLAHPAAAYGERALVGISHRILASDGPGAVERLSQPDAADRWHASMNAQSKSLGVQIHATIAWTETMTHLAVQRLATGFQTEARLLARRADQGLLHFAARPDGLVEGWMETDEQLYGPVTVPGIAIAADETGFESKVSQIAPFFIRYADASHLPRPRDLTSRPMM